MFSDSLVVEFTTRVVDNATLFSVDVGDSERLGLWQAVEEVERQANIVYLPDVVSSDVLIGDLSVAPGAFTPNGDGVNDEIDIRFTVYKVDQPVPEVTICDMSGRVVATLSETGATSAKHYRWDGVMDNGQMASPGMYLCKINIGAASGNDSVVRSLRHSLLRSPPFMMGAFAVHRDQKWIISPALIYCFSSAPRCFVSFP